MSYSGFSIKCRGYEHVKLYFHSSIHCTSCTGKSLPYVCCYLIGSLNWLCCITHSPRISDVPLLAQHTQYCRPAIARYKATTWHRPTYCIMSYVCFEQGFHMCLMCYPHVSAVWSQLCKHAWGYWKQRQCIKGNPYQWGWLMHWFILFCVT
jgi:hypothetical protein